MLFIVKKPQENMPKNSKANLIKFSLALFLMLMCNILLLNVSFADSSLKSNNSAIPTIIVLGDSISAAYGINTEQGWVTLLQSKITTISMKNRGMNYQIINASVSGDTTRTGLNRLLPLLKKHRPKIVIVALGGNDGLRGLPFTEIESSLSKIITLSQKYKAKVLLTGVRLPPNYGVAYNEKFMAAYKKVASKFNIALVPNLLANVDEKTELMQADGIHPKAPAQPQMLNNVWLKLQTYVSNNNQ